MAYNHLGTTMVGPNLAVAFNVGGARIAVPVARYLRAVDGDGGQWSGVAEASAGRLRATAQSFGPNWEAQAGVALPRAGVVVPEVWLLYNRNGGGVELRGIWTR